MSVSSVSVAAKTINLENLRHSESASELQQCLCIMLKKIGINDRNKIFFNYVIATFTFFHVISY